jgi:hypothetical protein
MKHILLGSLEGMNILDQKTSHTSQAEQSIFPNLSSDKSRATFLHIVSLSEMRQ